jgi:hypothetical protein
MSTQDIAEAKAAMQKAQKELEDAEARFIAGWKRRNGEELTDQYDQEFGTNALLKRLNDNLQSARKLFNDFKQQGIGIRLTRNF